MRIRGGWLVLVFGLVLMLALGWCLRWCFCCCCWSSCFVGVGVGVAGVGVGVGGVEDDPLTRGLVDSCTH